MRKMMNFSYGNIGRNFRTPYVEKDLGEKKRKKSRGMRCNVNN